MEISPPLAYLELKRNMTLLKLTSSQASIKMRAVTVLILSEPDHLLMNIKTKKIMMSYDDDCVKDFHNSSSCTIFSNSSTLKRWAAILYCILREGRATKKFWFLKKIFLSA